MPDILGYARVSTDDQDLAGQVLRLKAAGAARTYEDVISGRTFDRPGLKALLDYARAGDTLAVVRLDPHPSPHFASARAVVKASVLATAALNACNSGASLCSGMFGISS